MADHKGSFRLSFRLRAQEAPIGSSELCTLKRRPRRVGLGFRAKGLGFRV